MNWSSAFFGLGLAAGFFISFPFVALTIGSQLRDIRLTLITLAARRRSGRKPRNKPPANDAP